MIFNKSVLKSKHFTKNDMKVGKTFKVHISNKLQYLSELSFWGVHF